MKSFFLLLLLSVLYSISLSAQSNAKHPDKNWVMLSEGIFISKTEVSNLEYKEFLNAVAGNAAYMAAIWDTTAWSKALAYDKPFIEYYHKHPAYHQYPAVNMSQQGAALFCQWLTQVYNARADRKYQEVVIRLPTPEEMTMAIGKGLGWEGIPEASADMPPAYFRNDKGQLTANFRVIRQDAIREDGLLRDSLVVEQKGYFANEAVVTAPVKSYEPNALGLYNLQGNVAEWTTSADVAMGGSYLTTGWYLLPGRELQRDGTQGHPDTGFRYVVEVITP